MDAVCSNMHSIDLDKEISNWYKQKSANVIYRRYCDQLIVIIPIENQNTGVFAIIKKWVIQNY